MNHLVGSVAESCFEQPETQAHLSKHADHAGFGTHSATMTERRDTARTTARYFAGAAGGMKCGVITKAD